MVVNNMKELNAVITKAVSDALQNDIKEDVIQNFISSAQVQIYEAYEPSEYRRRFSYTKESAYKTKGSGGLKVVVKPFVAPNPVGEPAPTVGKDLTRLIEEGGGGSAWIMQEEAGYTGSIPFSEQRYDYREMGARPFVALTQAKVGNTLKMKMKAALQKRGLNVN